jgi:hypothetical protein
MSFSQTILRRRRTLQGQKGIYRFAQGFRKVSRTAILNHLIRRHGYRDYLEIGVRTNDNFRRVKAARKTGVDPTPEAPCTHVMTSDAFFAQLPLETRFDLVFIDGLHEEGQVWRDVHNSLEVLREGGTLALHDCNPPTAWHQRDGGDDGGRSGTARCGAPGRGSAARERTCACTSSIRTGASASCSAVPRKRRASPLQRGSTSKRCRRTGGRC